MKVRPNHAAVLCFLGLFGASSLPMGPPAGDEGGILSTVTTPLRMIHREAAAQESGDITTSHVYQLTSDLISEIDILREAMGVDVYPIEAEAQDCAVYNGSRFRKATQQIRGLTREDLGEALQRAAELCNQAGVAVALVPPLPKTALSGAAWWLSPKKAVIQLSARHKSDDHLWFSFFHEAAHILLHSKKNVFVDEVAGNGTDIEEEANRWAARTLVPPREWGRFVATSPRRKLAVQAFADQQGIAPGIVVGMLQHEGVIPWSHLNGLKVKLE